MTMRRHRNAKIVATLGPASSSPEMIRALFEAGADVFRLNFSHGTHDGPQGALRPIRAIEKDVGRPIGVLADLQGPKLRLGAFADGTGDARHGRRVRPRPRRRARATGRGSACRIRRSSRRSRPACSSCSTMARCGCEVHLQQQRDATTRVVVGGALSDRKGVNVAAPSCRCPRSRPRTGWTSPTRSTLGVDWIALSFVQRPDDMAELREHRRRPGRGDGQAREAGGDRAPGRDRRRSRTPSWSRAATSAWRCRPRRCRRSSGASSGPAGRPASPASSRRRCWNR